MKIRITGTPDQVELFVARVEIIAGTQCNYISKPYKQTRKCKDSKNISVYMDFEDYDLKDQANKKSRYAQHTGSSV